MLWSVADQGSRLAAQGQFSSLYNAMNKDPFGSVGGMSQSGCNEVDQLAFLQRQAAISNCGAPILCSYLGQTPDTEMPSC
jgi:hypothetical protein